MRNYIESGDIFTIPQSPANIKAGDIVVIGNIIGVSFADAKPGMPLVIKTSGVFVFLKTQGEVINVGQSIYMEVATSKVTVNKTDLLIGNAYSAATETDLYVHVCLRPPVPVVDVNGQDNSWLPPVIAIQNTPPVSHVEGDRYIIGTAPTGAWATHARSIAQSDGTDWTFTVPANGNVVVVLSLTAPNNIAQFNGTAWVQTPVIQSLVQGGNSFAADVEVGSRDAFGAHLVSGGVRRLGVSRLGQHIIPYVAPIAGVGNLSVALNSNTATLTAPDANIAVGDNLMIGATRFQVQAVSGTTVTFTTRAFSAITAQPYTIIKPNFIALGSGGGGLWFYTFDNNSYSLVSGSFRQTPGNLNPANIHSINAEGACGYRVWAISGSAGNSGIFQGFRARGTAAAPAVPIANDTLLSVQSFAFTQRTSDGNQSYSTAATYRHVQEVNQPEVGGNPVAPTSHIWASGHAGAVGVRDLLRLWSTGVFESLISGYEALVTQNNHLTNKKYVDDSKSIHPISATPRTSNYTLTAADRTVLFNAASGALTAGLPAANTVTGKEFVIKKTDNTANTVTIDPNGSETIDGALTFVLNAQWKAVTIQSNGTSWFILSAY